MGWLIVNFEEVIWGFDGLKWITNKGRKVNRRQERQKHRVSGVV